MFYNEKKAKKPTIATRKVVFMVFSDTAADSPELEGSLESEDEVAEDDCSGIGCNDTEALAASPL